MLSVSSKDKITNNRRRTIVSTYWAAHVCQRTDGYQNRRVLEQRPHSVGHPSDT